MDPQSPEPLAPQPRRFPLLPSLLVLLLGISSGFLGYQNWQLQKEISSLSSLPPSSPTLNPTTNWQTYTDKQKSFSFQYPQDWTTDDEQLLGSRKEIDFIYNRTTVLALSIIANYNNATGKPFKSLEEYIGQRITKARNITTGNLNGKLITDTGEEGHVIPYQEAILFSPNNTNILSLYYQAAYYENPQADEILNQILSTFQFLEQTANWKTYTNDSYKITFQYPPNLEMEINQVYSRNYIEFIFDKNSPNPFTIKASTKYPANQTKYLIDTGPYGSRNIGDNVWDMYSLSLDEGLQLEKNNVLYSVIYPPSRETTVNQILSTFQFLPTKP